MKSLYISIIIFIIVSCSNPEKSEDKSNYILLIEAATKTSLNFNSSKISRPGGIFVEVPKEFWAQEIANEIPLKVYSHNNNIALVQNENAQVEEGLYIYVGFSSYKPQNESQITYLTIVKDNVYHFVKKK